MSDSKHEVGNEPPGIRLNVFIAQASGISRRAADIAIKDGRVKVNNDPPVIGAKVGYSDMVTLDGARLMSKSTKTIVLNKPVGYVCSRQGQGNKTIYELLPTDLHQLKPVGRLDKDSSGLLMLTNDGGLANELTHPRYQKTKVYEVQLNKPLEPLHQQMISDLGITLGDGLSKFTIEKLDKTRKSLKITMSEGRNRQIRRTFETLGYNVDKLHRTSFGSYQIGELKMGKFTKA